MAYLSEDIVEHPVTSWDAVTFFCFVATTAMCLSFIFAGLLYRFGAPSDPEAFLVTNFFISAAIAFPTAVLAAQHDFRLRKNQSLLRRLAATDPLTGLLNRRFFKRNVLEALERLKREGGSVGLVIFDIDHFKRVNDEFGHPFGDLVLRRIAEIAHSELRGPFDRLGRWGGEEFVILLSGVNEDQANAISERIRRRIEEAIIAQGSKVARMTASFGITIMDRTSDLDSAMKGADEALLTAKRSGRNNVVLAD